MIGDKVIKMQGDNIEIDGELYIGTTGLWARGILKNTRHKIMSDAKNPSAK